MAESLVSEQNDITVIDQDPARVRALEERLDLRGVVGNGIQPSVLAEAGANADMVIACAALDESNLVVCKVAHDVFQVPTTIARLRSPEFEEGSPLLDKAGFAVDHVICPEESVMRHIHQLIDYPEALQVVVAQGRVCLIVVRAAAGGALVGHTIGEFRDRFPPAEMRVVALYRLDAEVEATAQTRILPGDEVFVLAASDRIRWVLAAIHNIDQPVQRVMIAGGGKVRAAGWPVPWSGSARSRSSRATPGAASTWPANCPPARWCCRATAWTKRCWRKRTSPTWTSSSR